MKLVKKTPRLWQGNGFGTSPAEYNVFDNRGKSRGEVKFRSGHWIWRENDELRYWMSYLKNLKHHIACAIDDKPVTAEQGRS